MSKQKEKSKQSIRHNRDQILVAESLQDFKQGGDPYGKMKVGYTHTKPIGEHPGPNKDQTYSEFVTNQLQEIDEFDQYLHTTRNYALDLMNNPEKTSPLFLNNIDGYMRDIRSLWKGIKGIMDIYTYSGERKNES